MGNRKQPFGYRVVMGEIALHPQESKLVEYIFQQYLAGATYNTLVEELREQSIPYDEGKLWNKNMIARILEDSRYTGERGYPPVIDREALEKALESEAQNRRQLPKRTRRSSSAASAGGHRQRTWSGRCWSCSIA